MPVKWAVAYEWLLNERSENGKRTMWECVCAVKGWLPTYVNDTIKAEDKLSDYHVTLTIDEIVRAELYFSTGVRRLAEKSDRVL
jgi:hypothetical protein